MAWIKEIIQPNRVKLSYWELINVFYDHKAQISMFNYGGWVDEAAYTDGVDPVVVESMQIPAGQAPQLAQGAMAFGNAVIRGLDKFHGSKTV